MKTLFISFALDDDVYRIALTKHLKPMVRAEKIALRSRDDVPTGADRAAFRETEMHGADIILLLLSADYMSEDDADAEYKLALALKQTAGKVLVPIVVKPSKAWEGTELAKLQPVRGGKPITTAPNVDQAWYEVVTELEKLLDRIPAEGKHPQPKSMQSTSGNDETAVKKVVIFLNSSEELEGDRHEFEIFLSRQNKYYIPKGFYLELQVWQDALQSLSKTGLQDRFNKMAEDSDIFVSLFHSDANKNSLAEFESALQRFMDQGKPLIYTYFRDSSVNIAALDRDKLTRFFDFQNRLEALGHRPISYKNSADLGLQFHRQLELVLPEVLASPMKSSQPKKNLY